MKYKFNKKHIVFDALSRFVNNKLMLFKDHSKFNVLDVYIT